MGPVLTVTVNPALDLTVHVATLHPGAMHLAHASRTVAGGKGVNVAACLADWGVPVVAGGFLGQANAAPFEALFAAKGVADHFVRLAGSTRTSIKLVADAGGQTTHIHLPGFAVPAMAWGALQARVLPLAQSGTWVVVAGSLPPDEAPSGYARLLEALAQAGALTVLDTRGPALQHALAPGRPMPTLIKPNRRELEALVDEPLPTLDDVAGVARMLQARGVETVVVTLGREGALMVRADGSWRAEALPSGPVSSVGAGDAMVAGLVAARRDGQDWPDALRLGVAFATATLGQPAPHLPSRATVRTLAEAVVVRPW